MALKEIPMYKKFGGEQYKRVSPDFYFYQRPMNNLLKDYYKLIGCKVRTVQTTANGERGAVIYALPNGSPFFLHSYNTGHSRSIKMDELIRLGIDHEKAHELMSMMPHEFFEFMIKFYNNNR